MNAYIKTFKHIYSFEDTWLGLVKSISPDWDQIQERVNKAN